MFTCPTMSPMSPPSNALSTSTSLSSAPKFSESLHRLSVSAPPPPSVLSNQPTPPSPRSHAWSGLVDPSSPTSSTTLTVRYGSKIRLFAKSHYLKPASTYPGGYAGYYFRSRKGVKGEEGIILTGKETQLAILSPAGPEKENLYHESHFHVVDPNGVKQDGDLVRYGEEFVLVDDAGMSWNTTAGGITNYLGFKRVGLPGELCLTFKRAQDAGKNGGVGSSSEMDASGRNSPVPPLGDSPRMPKMPPGSRKKAQATYNPGAPPVRINDDVYLVVTRTTRTNKKMNNYIANFKRGTSRVLGGYLTCEKVGFPQTFSIHRAPPGILLATTFTYSSEMSVHTHHGVQWGEEIELSVPTDVDLGDSQPLLTVTLSSGDVALFTQSMITANAGKAFWVDVRGSDLSADPSRLMVQFDCFNGNDSFKRRLGSNTKNATVAIFWSLAFVVAAAAAVFAAVKKSQFVMLSAVQADGNLTTVSAWEVAAPLLGTEEPEIVVKYLWPSWTLLASAATGATISLLIMIGSFYYKFGDLLLKFDLRIYDKDSDRKRSHAPFVGVLLGWETGLAKDATQPQAKLKNLVNRYGAIDPTTGLPPMPERFLIAEEWDKDKALERWRDTLSWREEQQADDVLNVCHSQFDTIQRYYPQSFYCRDRKGNMVYIERPGGVEISKIKKNGISIKKLIWHYMYCMEYLWQVISPKETDRLTTILDLEGVSLFMVVGDVRNFITGCIKMTTTHYPARGHKLFIINCPGWFSNVWSWIKPMLNSAIEEKLQILKSGEKQNRKLLEIIDEENLPLKYGGQNADTFGDSVYDKSFKKHVVDVLEKHGESMATFV